MPYSSDDKEKIMKKFGYTKHEAEIFIKAFNAALDHYGSEERAFKVAHAAVNKYQSKKEKKKSQDHIQKALPVGEWDRDYVLAPQEMLGPFEEHFVEGFVRAIQSVEEVEEDHITPEIQADQSDILEMFLAAMEGEVEPSIQMPNGSVWSQRTVLDTNDLRIVALRPMDMLTDQSLYVAVASSPAAYNTAQWLMRNKRAVVVRQETPDEWVLARNK